MNIKKLERELKGKRAGDYAPMYIYGTEMMSNYYSKINIKNKTILTIAGSGDQIINAYFFGAKTVIGFDLNKLAKYMIDLKITAIKILDYNEFLKFFGTGKKNATLNYKLYLKLSLRLNKSTKRFFDSLYKYYKFDGKKLAKSSFIHQRELAQSTLGEINIYLKNKRNYSKIRKILSNKKIKIIHKNISKLKLKKKFDIINISNVPNFLTGFTFIQKKDPVMELHDKILLKLKNLLTKKGKIIFYLYSPQNYPNIFATVIPPTTIPKELNKIKKSPKFKVKEYKFKGIHIGRDKIISLENR